MTATDTPAIGTPVLSPNGAGFISRVLPARERIFTIGADGLQKVQSDFEICFPERLTILADSIVAPWINRAAGLPPVPADEIEVRRAAAEQATSLAREDARQSQARAEEARAAFKIEAAAKMPAWAKAVIVAELVEDRSDTMTDYFGSTTVRTVILGFSAHTRDLFPELRKAALNFAETADLATADGKAEHREKYSMGAGYYLKAGWRDSNGWKVSKRRLYQGSDSIPSGEWSLAPETPVPAAPVTTAAGASISEHTHTKGGFQMWVVAMAGRVEREEYDRLLTAAKASGGWYSRKWGDTPAGFAFKSEEKAQAFVAELGAAPAADDAPAPAARPGAGGAAVAAKMRSLADAMQPDIDHKFSERRSNTPKQQRDAAGARLDGYRLQRTQQGLRALADLHDAGKVPAELRGVTTKAAAFDLARGEIDRSGGYYDAGRETGRPATNTPAAVAFWSLLTGPSEDEKRAAALREKIDGLKFAKIPGYFPTPSPVVARMLEAADIPAGGCSVLEPEAGSGAILDQVREVEPGCSFVVFERHSTLRSILQDKGYSLAGDDFMQSDTAIKVERVMMNPPFENGQDAAHVMRAFGHLAPGGRLVAIMSPGPFYRQDAKSQAFRAWFEARGGEKTDLPAGAFKESGTGVATVLVEIRA